MTSKRNADLNVNVNWNVNKHLLVSGYEHLICTYGQHHDEMLYASLLPLAGGGIKIYFTAMIDSYGRQN